MKPHYSDDWLTVYHGDARTVLAELPAESVHCVVTSPPYWGLRDYGTATWIGGDEACDHKSHRTGRKEQGDEFRARGVERGYAPGSNFANYGDRMTDGSVYRHTCGKCGAIRQDSQLGLEPTPEQYVENMVAVFREVRRVLRSDGTVWLNLGDSYSVASTHKGGNKAGIHAHGENSAKAINGRDHGRTDGLKPKDLVGIPWRVAFALQADGWYLRSDIIWSKPNPMPESVTDRPTKSHEYLFLLSKSARYYFDADAVREANAPAYAKPRTIIRRSDAKTSSDGVNDGRTMKANNAAGMDAGRYSGLGRNLRSVWSIATAPYPGAHFATFPPKLVEPCIKAGSPEGGVVLDCFAGSGTTGMVAQSLSRRAILIDLSMDYLDQLMHRNRDIPLGLDVA